MSGLIFLSYHLECLLKPSQHSDLMDLKYL